MLCCERKTALLIVVVSALFLVSGCALSPRLQQVKSIGSEHKKVFIVRVKAGDTLDSLASAYYKDASKAWLIKEYNQIATLHPGQALVIPDPSFKPGGLDVTGYQTIPVLAYQQILKKSKAPQVVVKSEFEKQMRYLRDNKFTTIDSDQLMEFFEFKAKLPSKSLLITLNGGFTSVYEIAAPILKRNGMTATLFICTDRVGKKGFMSWDQLRILSKSGFSIQAMARQCKDLSLIENKKAFKASVLAIKKKLHADRRLIEKKTGADCRYLAYPCDKTDRLVTALARTSGYRAAYTLEPGVAAFFSDPYHINRILIPGHITLDDFKNSLSLFAREGLR